MNDKLDVLAFAVHPDDAELGCAGTLLKLVSEGKRIGIVDLTRGELGSRGTPELRMEEATAAARVLGLHARENLGYRDGFFRNDEEHQMGIIRMIRKYQPEVVLAGAPFDRHPDHGRSSELVRDAAFYSGLAQVKTETEEGPQTAWRPKRLFYYIQDHYLTPNFVIDISAHWETKLQAIRAFGSQFYNPEYDGPKTYISNQDFWHWLEGRARDMGHITGATFGEGFISDRPLAVASPLDLI